MSASKITLILPFPKQRNDVSDIFTSDDMENMSLLSRMQFHVKSTSDVFYRQLNTYIYVIKGNKTV